MGWVASQFNNMITNLVQGFVNDILKLVVNILGAFVVNPIHMNSLPGFSTLELSIETLCSLALGFVLAKELMLNQYESLGDMDVPPLVIVKNTVFSAFLIWLSPLLVQQVLLRLVVDITQLVRSTIGASVTVHLNNLLSLSIGTGATAAATAQATGEAVVQNTMVDALMPDLGFWAVVIIVLAIIIGFAIIGIQSGMRWAELYFLALIGPVLALSRASFGNAWGQWLRETIATAFSQLVQYFATLLALVIMVHPGTIDAANGGSVGGIVKLCMILGLIVFAIVGPKTLRGLISGANPTGMKAVAGLAKSAVGGMPFGN